MCDETQNFIVIEEDEDVIHIVEICGYEFKCRQNVTSKYGLLNQS